MINIEGKFNTAVVYNDHLDERTVEQIREMCDLQYLAGETIRVMPDAHAGAGCTIGTTMTLHNRMVTPNFVGVDIGCGMLTVELKRGAGSIDRDYLIKLDRFVRKHIPSGRSLRKITHEHARAIDIKQAAELFCRNQVNSHKAFYAMGTLGGGNHFIEIDQDEAGKYYLIIHTGSRHLGLEVAKHYQEQAWQQEIARQNAGRQKIIDKYQTAGKTEQIDGAIQEYNAGISDTVTKSNSYLAEALFDNSIHDMLFMQHWAEENREAIADDILAFMGVKAKKRWHTVHNYVAPEEALGCYVLRKGAVSAQAGEKILVPLNMRDGSLICEGKGNAEWNYSAPHGAGRLMSRTEAFNTLSVEEFKEAMTGIYTTSCNESTLDEAPMSYKDAREIEKYIEPTAEIIGRLQPVYNF
jgi:RNA-splicing ligase RtcB